MLKKKRRRRNRKISLEKTQEELTFEKKRMEALFKHYMDYDVMTNGRPYKKRLSIQEAINEVLRCSGTQFDPSLVELFLETLSDYNT